jgi:hypothetical protein
MGLLADIYLASDDAHALQYDSAPQASTHRLQVGVITELQLSMLWAVVQGVKWEAKSLRQFVNVFHTDDGERLITRLPAALLTELANLSPEQISAVAQKWAATAEMSCKPDSARTIIEGLIVSGRKAAETQQNVYLWNCV